MQLVDGLIDGEAAEQYAEDWVTRFPSGAFPRPTTEEIAKNG